MDPATPGPDAVFTGSALASDYIFDIDAPPAAHPVDVQTYLYVLGSPSPSGDRRDWHWAMEAGARILRAARDQQEGFFVRALGPDAKAACPHFPWLAGVSYAQATAALAIERNDVCPMLAGAQDELAEYAGDVLLTNTRIPLPAGTIGPAHPRWVELVLYMYENHPLFIRMCGYTAARTWPTDDALRRVRDGLLRQCSEYGTDGAPGAEDGVTMLDEDDPHSFEPAL